MHFPKLLALTLLLPLACMGPAQQVESTLPALEVPVQGGIAAPAHWERLDSVPIASLPEPVAAGCARDPLPPEAFEGMAAAYRVGEDTVYVERERSIYWAWGSYGGCAMAYEPADSNGRMELRRYYDLDSGATRKEYERYKHEAIPSLDLIERGGKEFTYVNQSSDMHPGPSGMFFPGDAKSAPLNVFGYRLHYEAKQEIFDFIKGLEFR